MTERVCRSQIIKSALGDKMRLDNDKLWQKVLKILEVAYYCELATDPLFESWFPDLDKEGLRKRRQSLMAFNTQLPEKKVKLIPEDFLLYEEIFKRLFSYYRGLQEQRIGLTDQLSSLTKVFPGLHSAKLQQYVVKDISEISATGNGTSSKGGAKEFARMKAANSIGYRTASSVRRAAKRAGFTLEKHGFGERNDLLIYRMLFNHGRLENMIKKGEIVQHEAFSEWNSTKEKAESIKKNIHDAIASSLSKQRMREQREC